MALYHVDFSAFDLRVGYLVKFLKLGDREILGATIFMFVKVMTTHKLTAI